MPLYQYSAIDILGKKRSGLLEAQGEKEAKEKLRDQSLMVSSLSLKTGGSSKENLRGDSLQTFTLQLSQLVNAGVPLYQSLVAIEEQYRNESYHRVLLSLCEQIKAGTPLSQAMANYPNSFDKLYCSMIAAGESAGALNVVLEKLSILLGKQNKLKRQMITALIYPSILASFSALIIVVLLTFVIPAMEGIFEGRTLNRFTSSVLSLSYFFRTYWLIYLPLLIGVGAFIFFKLRSAQGKLWLQRNLIKIPLIRTLIIQATIARFTRTMGTLQQGGLTIIDSMQISREVMGNVVLEEEMKKAESKVVEGSSLSIELSRSKWIPLMVSRMLSVGEDSGTTTVMLHKIADIYEEDVEKTIDRIMALAQPVILVFMGSVIVLVMLAILLPMTDVSAFTQ